MYECMRKSVLPITNDSQNIKEYVTWCDISTELVDTIIESMSPLLKTIGYFAPDKQTEVIKKQLEAGNIIELTNFYIRKKFGDEKFAHSNTFFEV